MNTTQPGPWPARIREEAPEDVAAIHRLNASAFETDAEAKLVDALRAAGALTLSLVQPVWARVYVRETDLALARTGTAVRLGTDSLPGRTFAGHIGFVSPTAEFTPKSVETPDLRTDLVYRLRIVVDDPQGELRQGMPVTVDLGRPAA